MEWLEGQLESFEHEGITYEVGSDVNYTALHWSSDWNGYEVGYDDIDVVGLYSFPYTEVYVYINVDDGTILEMWTDIEETDLPMHLDQWEETE